MQLIQSLHWPSVLLSALAAFLFGWFYYSPWVFGKAWARASHVSLREQPGFLRLSAAYAVLVLLAIGMHFAIEMVHAKNLIEAGRLAGLLVLFFVMPFELSKVIWERQPLGYFLVNAGYQFIALLLIAVILISIG